MLNFPKIIFCAREIAYDYGMINVGRTEEEFMGRVDILLQAKDLQTLTQVEESLCKFSDAQLIEICTGDQDECEDPGEDASELLHDIFTYC